MTSKAELTSEASLGLPSSERRSGNRSYCLWDDGPKYHHDHVSNEHARPVSRSRWNRKDVTCTTRVRFHALWPEFSTEPILEIVSRRIGTRAVDPRLAYRSTSSIDRLKRARRRSVRRIFIVGTLIVLAACAAFLYRSLFSNVDRRVIAQQSQNEPSRSRNANPE